MCFIFISDYDYEEPKKEGKGGKCMKGNRCGKAEKDPKDSKKGTGTFSFSWMLQNKMNLMDYIICPAFIFQIMIMIMKNQRRKKRVENA